MTRVINTLKRLGLAFAAHHIEAEDAQRSRLTVRAEGSSPEQGVRDALAATRSVEQVVQVSSEEEPVGDS